MKRGGGQGFADTEEKGREQEAPNRRCLMGSDRGKGGRKEGRGRRGSIERHIAIIPGQEDVDVVDVQVWPMGCCEERTTEDAAEERATLSPEQE